MRHLLPLLSAPLLLGALLLPAPAATDAAPSATAAPTVSLYFPPTAAPTAAPRSARPQPTARPARQARPTPQPPQPTATPQPEAGGAPVRLVIDAIGLDRPLVGVGLDKNRIPIVPDHDVGWYNLSAGPGQGENIVLWGHVLRFRKAPKIPAPFARLKELKVGASVVLYDARGEAHRYVVTTQVWATPDQVEYILPQGSERVTMVSCIGDKVIQGKEVVEMTHRLITIAEPVEEG